VHDGSGIDVDLLDDRRRRFGRNEERTAPTCAGLATVQDVQAALDAITVKDDGLLGEI
jgi:hypothetical protein